MQQAVAQQRFSCSHSDAALHSRRITQQPAPCASASASLLCCRYGSDMPGRAEVG